MFVSSRPIDVLHWVESLWDGKGKQVRQYACLMSRRLRVVAGEKQNYYCVFVALVMQHAKRVRHIASYVACTAVPLLSTLSHKRHDFRKDVI
jgi:hypothetical protein